MWTAEESSTDAYAAGSTMAIVSTAVFCLFLVCAAIRLEQIDAMSLICYSSTPPIGTDESGVTESTFSPDFTTRLDIIITESPHETTTSETKVPIINHTQTPSETASTLPVITTTTSATTLPPSETTSTTLPAITTTTSATTLPPYETTSTTLPAITTPTSATTTTIPPSATSTTTSATMTSSVDLTETTPVETSPATTSPCGNCPHIVTRAEWGANAPKAIEAIVHPIPKVFIHHTANDSCTTQANCSRRVKQIQTYHQKDKIGKKNEKIEGWDDIGYNFLVGEDGNAYEGRGWDLKGAHAKKWNPVALGIAVIGDFTARVPNAAALNTVHQLIDCGVCKKKIAVNYTLHGHRDACPTACPGNAFYGIVIHWPHYGGNLGGKC